MRTSGGSNRSYSYKRLAQAIKYSAAATQYRYYDDATSPIYMGLYSTTTQRLGSRLPCLLHLVSQHRPIYLMRAALPDIPAGDQLLLKYKPLQTEKLKLSREVELWRRVDHAPFDIYHDEKIGKVTLQEALEEHIRPGICLARKNGLPKNIEGFYEMPIASDPFVLVSFRTMDVEILLTSKWVKNHKKAGANRICIETCETTDNFKAAMALAFHDVKYKRRTEWHISLSGRAKDYSLEEFYTAVQNSPHLWPEIMRAAMPEGTKTIIRPQTDGTKYTWATASQNEPETYDEQLHVNKRIQMARRAKQSEVDAARALRYQKWKRLIGKEHFLTMKNDVFKKAYSQGVPRDSWDDLLLNRLIRSHSVTNHNAALRRFLFRNDATAMAAEMSLEVRGLIPSKVAYPMLASQKPGALERDVKKKMADENTSIAWRRIRQGRKERRRSRKSVQAIRQRRLRRIQIGAINNKNREAQSDLQPSTSYGDGTSKAPDPDLLTIKHVRWEAREKARQGSIKLVESLMTKRREDQNRAFRRSKTIDALLQSGKRMRRGKI